MVKKDMLERFNHDIYLLECEYEKYFIHDSNNNLLFYAEISETPYVANDIRIYTDEKKDNELLRIQTNQNFSYYKSYTIIDVTKSKTIGYAKLSSLKSVFIDQWRILNSQKKDIGYIKEESYLLSVLRFTMSMLIPQKFYIIIDNKKISFFEQNFHPLSIKMKLDFSLDTTNVLDKKLGIAYAILVTIKTHNPCLNVV